MDRTHRSAAQTERADIYTRITQEIVATIEAGLEAREGTMPARWRCPWHHDGGVIARPMNLASGKRCRGINVLALWVAAIKSGYGSGLWGTYRQFAEAGAQVRKGERATTVVFWKQFRRGETDDEAGAAGGRDGGDREDGEGRPRFMAKGYAVFNAAQVDGLDLPPQPVLPETERIEGAERFFANLPIPIRIEGDQACYVPSLDVVRMPPFARFRSAPEYYATLAHECGHATGAKHRLNRDLSGCFGSERYAVDEQVAELTASFVMADLGLAYGPRPESVAYLASWLKVLKNDTRAIFTAASKAQAAVDWMHAQQPGAERASAAEASDEGTADPNEARGDAIVAAAA
ncbi:MAG: ArdC family protein [Beijerinckiaceae bacterium]